MGGFLKMDTNMGWRNIIKQYRSRPRALREGGNAIAMIFMAIGMAGVVTYGLNNVMRGPAVTAAETARRTIAENNLIATARLAITASARQAVNKGDCDADGFVEPLPFRAPVAPAVGPTGGGFLPMTLGATMTDPWGNQYGYCVWDPGTVSKSDNHPNCGTTPNRLEGAPRDDQPAIAIISAGKNGTFQTTCNAYLDTTPADGKPDTAMVVKAPGSDDSVLTYTYAEANGAGSGLWKIRLDAGNAETNIAEIGMNIESTSSAGATFGGKVELRNKGLVLPGDPGDDSVTGACDAAKDGQMRRNTANAPAAPTLEMCDFSNGGGWTQITGSSTPDVFDPKRANCAAAEAGPFTVAASTTLIGHPSGLWSKVGRSGAQTLFVAGDIASGTNVLKFDGSGFSLLKHDARPNRLITGEGDYIFTTMPAWEYIDVWRWDGADLTLIDTVATPSGEYPGGLWANSDGNVYVAEYGNGVGIYNFDGTNLNLITRGGAGTALSVQERDGYLYTSGWPRRTHYWDGATITTPVNSVNGNVTRDADHVYVWDASEISAYTFDGTTETLVDTSTGGLGGTIWTDGAHIFSLNGTPAKLRAITFDGTSFTEVAEIELPDQPASVSGASVTGDGNYIYVALTGAANDGRIYAVAGFGCTSPAVPGGYVAPKPVPVSAAKKYVPEPLDVGLVAHWKMDEAEGDMIDSIGTNNGTLLNNTTRAVGQHGTGALHFNGEDRDGVEIAGLLGSPQKLTIAGWVNISGLDENGTPDTAEIFHMGNDQVYLGYYRGIGLGFYYTGNDAEAPNSDFILNDGWHYIVATLDTETEEVMRLYIDGLLYKESPAVDAITWSAGANTYMGRSPVNTGQDMTGSVDDFRFYNRALGASEVAQLTKKAKLEGAEAGPVSTAAPTLSADNKISASPDYSCGIKKDGSMWCWGRDWPNQTLGNGPSRLQQGSPVQVTEPDAQVYYLTNTNSTITTGDYYKMFSPHLVTQKVVLSNFDIGANGPKYIYGYTPTNQPIPLMAGSKNYKLILTMDPPSGCISPVAVLSRVTSGGFPNSYLLMSPDFDLGGEYDNTFSSGQYVLYGSGDLGAFTTTEMLRSEIQLWTWSGNPNCAGTQTFDLTAELHMPRIEHGTWTSVTTSSTHACGLKSDGSAWCWGMDSSDSLGNSGFASGLYDKPSRVVDTGTPWRQLSAGPQHTCGIQSDGTLWCWGGDVEGQLGNGAATGLKAQPGQVGTDADWASVTTGGLFTCAIKTNGRAYCWGDDAYGQLANGAASSADQISPYLVPDPGPWVKISAGLEHACGIKADSTAWCWGHSTARELGIPSSSNLTSPLKISKPDGWVDVSAGSFFTCAVNRDGKTYCWGEVNNGRLGNPAITSDNFMPTEVVGSEGSTAVTAGGDHACLTKANGIVMCWGNDPYGQLGNGAALTAAQSAPTPVTGFAGSQSWGWNDAATIIMAPYQANIGLNGNALITGAGSKRGFGFTSTGRAFITQDTDSNQVLLEASGAASSSQLTFNTVAPAGTIDPGIPGLNTIWKFNEISGTTAASTPAGYTATLTNGPVWNDKGRIGSSLVFDGVDDYLVIPNDARHRPAAITVAAWVKPAAVQTMGAKIISKRNNVSGNTYGLSMSGTGGWVTFEYYTTDNTLWKVQSTVPLKANTWNYVVAGYDRNGSAPRARIFVNGVNATPTGAPASSLSLSYNTATPAGDLYIGSDYTGTQKFKGEIDDVRIYASRMEDRKVMQLYNFQISQISLRRSMGINHVTNNLDVTLNSSNTTLDQYTPPFTQLSLSAAGRLGIGNDNPTARLDVNGSVRFGTEEVCDTNRTGAMRYTGGTPPWSYCNGTAWTEFENFNKMGWKKDLNALSMGDGYVCAIAQTGKLYCWGVNSYGRLGDGTLTDVTLINEVHTDTGLPGWSDWKFVSGNVETTCGIRTNGTLWCWGRNSEGQLGNGSTLDSYRPIQVRDDVGTGYWSDWTYVTAGQYNVCGIRTNGRLYCWGDGWYGTNGDGTQNNYSLPHETSMDTGSPPGYSDWKTVSMGLTTGCGLRGNGTIYCWGANSNYNVGINSSVTPQTRPQRVHDTGGAPTWTDWVEVTSGNNVSCGRRTDGRAYCWGIGGNRGDNSAFGGSYNGRPQIVHDEAAPASWLDWKYITTGFENVCALRTNGKLYCWGDDTYQQLHYNGGKRRPYGILNDTGGPAWTDWVNVKTGIFTVCGVRSDSTLWCWGYMDMGTGNGTNYWTQTYPNKVNSP